MVRSTNVPYTMGSQPETLTLSTDVERRRNPLARLFRPFSPSSFTLPNATIPKSIHALLGCELQAYAVFKPRISDLFDLFHIVHITDGSESNRHRSPIYTFANFKTICEEMRADAHVGDPETLEISVIDRLCEEMQKVDEKNNQESPIFGIATASSIENAISFAASAGVPGAISVGATLTRTRTALREFSLSVTKTAKYSGGNKLNRLIWKHGEVLFMRILEELGGDGNISTMAVGHRKLIAIVIKKIMGDINIARERTYVVEFGSNAGGVNGTFGAMMNVNKSRLQRDNSHHEGGISGIHFIEFPMERIDDFRFRFLPGINVGPVGDDDLDGSNPDAFYRYERWLQGETQGDDSVQPGNSILVGLNEASMDKEMENIAMSREELEARWIDCRPKLNRAALEVDLTPRLYKFSMNQARMGRECWMRARSQCSSTDDRLHARSVNFFRSALRTVCYEATLHGLDGLSRWHDELCEEKERMKGSLFRYCARTLRQVEECWEVWRKLLEVRRELIEDSKPETRIAEMVCLVSSGPRRSIYILFRRLSFGTAGKQYGSQGSASKMSNLGLPRQNVAQIAWLGKAVPLHTTGEPDAIFAIPRDEDLNSFDDVNSIRWWFLSFSVFFLALIYWEYTLVAGFVIHD